MPGYSDYAAEAFINWTSGQAPVAAISNRFLALFTAAPADSGSGGTEVSGGAYARVQVAGAVAATASFTTASPNITMTTNPGWVVAGMNVYDLTNNQQIGTVSSYSGTALVLTANAAHASSGSTDSLQFSAWPAASASSGAEPATTPAQALNAAIIAFAQSTGSWGTAVFWGLFDAATSGNFIEGDYLGNFKWLPFSCSSASPGVITSPGHGYSNGDSVVITQKYGGTLPSTAGSWSGILTVANVTTDTFTVGVNTTSTGDGQVRKVQQQAIPINNAPSFAANTLTLTNA